MGVLPMRSVTLSAMWEVCFVKYTASVLAGAAAHKRMDVRSDPHALDAPCTYRP